MCIVHGYGRMIVSFQFNAINSFIISQKVSLFLCSRFGFKSRCCSATVFAARCGTPVAPLAAGSTVRAPALLAFRVRNGPSELHRVRRNAPSSRPVAGQQLTQCGPALDDDDHHDHDADVDTFEPPAGGLRREGLPQHSASDVHRGEVSLSLWRSRVRPSQLRGQAHGASLHAWPSHSGEGTPIRFHWMWYKCLPT